MNTSKYVALALSSPKGIKLREKVEEAWPQWLQHVEDATWLRNFKDSPLLKKQEQACTPEGAPVAEWYRYPHHAVADAIYATVVWGFGMEGRHEYDTYWSKTAREMLSHWPGRTSISIYGLCETKTSSNMPRMFAELDSWLDTLWV